MVVYYSYLVRFACLRFAFLTTAYREGISSTCLGVVTCGVQKHGKGTYGLIPAAVFSTNLVSVISLSAHWMVHSPTVYSGMYIVNNEQE